MGNATSKTRHWPWRGRRWRAEQEAYSRRWLTSL